MTRARYACWVVLAAAAHGCSCGDDDDDSGARLGELAEIGEEGDTFTLGELVGVVPAGAVEGGGTVVVRGTIRDDVGPPPGGIGPIYELEVDRELREPITLELPCDADDLGGRSPVGLRVASSPDGSVWDCDPAIAPRAESTSVLAVVSHLSFWTLRYLPCEGANDCDLPERCFDPGPNGYCATPCASDADCLSPTYCFCGICSRDSCEQPANDCPIGTHCSVDEADQRGVCLPECTPLDRCGLPEEQQLCSPGGRCAFQESALCPDRYTCADDHTCSHAWCVPTDTSGCECGVDEGCACETPAECPDDGTEHEACENGEDDDDDSDIDCLDIDCGDEPGCVAALPEDCATPGDEDGDGDADCADSDCAADPACAGGPWPLALRAYGRRDVNGWVPQEADWLVFQDGDGEWTELVADAGVYAALVTDPDGRYGVAWACVDTATVVTVLRAVATEGGNVVLPGCPGVGGRPTSRVDGQVIGGNCPTVNVFNQTQDVGCVFDTFGPLDVPNGIVDVVAQSDPAQRPGALGFVQRDIDLAGDTSFTVDFTGPDAFELVQAERDSTNITISFLSKNEGHMALTFGSVDLTYGGVPAAAQVEGEGHMAYIFGADFGTVETAYFKEPIDLVTGPAAPTFPDATGTRVAEEPYTLYAIDVDSVPVGVGAFTLEVVGPASIWNFMVTTAWLGGGTRLETPDLSGATGWQAGYATDPNATVTLGLQVPDGGTPIECFSAPIFAALARDGLRCRARQGLAVSF